MTNLRTVLPSILVFLAAACTGGPGDLPGSTSSGGSSTGSSGGSSGASSSGGDRQIRASDFDQSCTGDQDCVAIYEGDVCSPCGCPNAAIALTDRQTYNGAYQSKRSDIDCAQPDIQCDVCAAPAVACAAGTCAINR